MSCLFKTEIPTGDELLDFYERMGWNAFLKLTQNQILTAMRQSYYSVYVYDVNKLIATGRVVSDGVINAYICGLGVLPSYRNCGIGTAIMKQLTERCRQANLHIQFLCEEHLVPYYQKNGFEEFAVGMKFTHSLL